ncbi:MAG: DUF4123 domain-containing protein [Bryobacterales bacterium]|nr:DUF4123 domain-containing protein [Bryobacterales bacterium]
MMAREAAHPLLTVLWPESLSSRIGNWAVLDGARNERIYGAIYRSYLDKCCLYAGELPWQLQMAAPYLVQLDKDDAASVSLIKQGWGDSWGIYARSSASLATLRKHFRGFLRVRDHAGRKLVFRYYDPRVMRVYLPTCTPEELETVFGPVESYVMESEDANVAIEYSLENRRLRERRISLGQMAARV